MGGMFQMFMTNQTIGMNQIPQQQQPLLPAPNQILRSNSNPNTPNHQNRHHSDNNILTTNNPSQLKQSKSAMNVQPSMSTFNSDRSNQRETNKLKISTKHLRKS